VTRPLVVCVDDDPDLLAGVVRSLKALPIEILSTTEPQGALDWVAERDVAVLVSDFEMPGMNGVVLVSKARVLRPETVRILLTGVRAFATAIDGINQGEVFRYINKPFDRAQLRDAVTAAVERHHELVATVSERERSKRRAQIAAALEVEFPGLTHVVRAFDGAYIVPPTSPDIAAALGVDGLAVRRQP
jgi:DNA-binding NtrC family response regulator